jgi:hypothetical protein
VDGRQLAGPGGLDLHDVIYDDFHSATLDPSRWHIGQMYDAEGAAHEYLDANAIVETGDGRVQVSVNPFSRFHDTVPVLNNPKALYLSTQRLETPPGSRTTFECDMSVETFHALSGDLRDAFGTFNLLHFQSGVVLDFAVTNELVYIVFERLLIPGITSQDQYFTVHAA